MALDFNQYATQGNTFLKDYAKEMNFGEDTEKAGRIFIAIMHALRDIIPPEESLQFIAQLPMFIKAIYVNGWNMTKKKPKVKNMADFLNLVKERDWPVAVNDFGYTNEAAELYVNTTFIYLRKYVSFGELEDIRSGLPKDLKRMIYPDVKF